MANASGRRDAEGNVSRTSTSSEIEIEIEIEIESGEIRGIEGKASGSSAILSGTESAILSGRESDDDGHSPSSPSTYFCSYSYCAPSSNLAGLRRSDLGHRSLLVHLCRTLLVHLGSRPLSSAARHPNGRAPCAGRTEEGAVAILRVRSRMTGDVGANLEAEVGDDHCCTVALALLRRSEARPPVDWCSVAFLLPRVAQRPTVQP